MVTHQLQVERRTGKVRHCATPPCVCGRCYLPTGGSRQHGLPVPSVCASWTAFATSVRAPGMCPYSVARPTLWRNYLRESGGENEKSTARRLSTVAAGALNRQHATLSNITKGKRNRERQPKPRIYNRKEDLKARKCTRGRQRR